MNDQTPLLNGMAYTLGEVLGIRQSATLIDDYREEMEAAGGVDPGVLQLISFLAEMLRQTATSKESVLEFAHRANARLQTKLAAIDHARRAHQQQPEPDPAFAQAYLDQLMATHGPQPDALPPGIDMAE